MKREISRCLPCAKRKGFRIIQRVMTRDTAYSLLCILLLGVFYNIII